MSNKHKLIKLYLNKKYILGFRIVMLFCSYPFMLKVYEALINGYATMPNSIAVQGENWGYYAYLFQKIAELSFIVVHGVQEWIET